MLTLKQVAWQLIFISGRTILAVPSKGLRHWVHRSFSCTILFNREVRISPGNHHIVFFFSNLYLIFHHEHWFMLEITLHFLVQWLLRQLWLSIRNMSFSLEELNFKSSIVFPLEGKMNTISHIFTCQTSQRSSLCRMDLKECHQTCWETCRYQRSGYFTVLRHIYIQP